MCEDRVQNGKKMVGRGGIELRYCTAVAVTSNAICWQIEGSIPLEKRHQRRNCTIRRMYDRPVQKTEGQNVVLEHKLSADTFLDGCIQKIGS